MTFDIFTVMWKESKNLFRDRGSRTRTVLTLLAPLFLAVYLPWESGNNWVDGPVSLLPVLAIPVLLVGLTVPDSFAGERERHTLETLLASRLPDRAIFFGKILPSVGLAWGVALFVLLVGLVTVNIVPGRSELMLYTPVVAIAGVGLSLLVATLAAATGVLISLRVGTVQEASQMLMMSFLVPPMLAGPLALVLFRGNIKETLGNPDPVLLLGVVAAVLALASLAVLAAAMARFQRARLILD